MNSSEIERVTAEASRRGWYYTMPVLGQFVYFKGAASIGVNYQPASGAIVDAAVQVRGEGNCPPCSTTIVGANDTEKLCSVLARLRGN